jgi:hypothetical protein
MFKGTTGLKAIIITSTFGVWSGCTLSSTQASHEEESASEDALVLQARQSGHGSGGSGRHEGILCLKKKTLLNEPWNVFDETVWAGDGDQEVSGGFFQGNALTNASAADFIPEQPVAIPVNGSVVFSNRVHLVDRDGEPNLETGAILMVNSDTDGTFQNYVFLNFGFARNPNMVFVELFGSDNGREFDQIKELTLADPQRPIVDLDLWIRKNQYLVGVAGEVLDSVALGQPLDSLGLFEVGVYGSRIDSTSITVTESKSGHGGWSGPRTFKCKHDKRRIGKNSHLRNAHIRMAREKMKHSRNPSHGMKCLAKLKESSES